MYGNNRQITNIRNFASWWIHIPCTLCRLTGPTWLRRWTLLDYPVSIVLLETKIFYLYCERFCDKLVPLVNLRWHRGTHKPYLCWWTPAQWVTQLLYVWQVSSYVCIYHRLYCNYLRFFSCLDSISCSIRYSNRSNSTPLSNWTQCSNIPAGICEKSELILVNATFSAAITR